MCQIWSKSWMYCWVNGASSILCTMFDTAGPRSYPRSAVVKPWSGAYAAVSSTTANDCIGAPVWFERKVTFCRTQSAHSRAIARWVSLLRRRISNSVPYSAASRPLSFGMKN